MSRASEEHAELMELRHAITARCILCSGSRKEAARCRVMDCPLRPYRPMRTIHKRAEGQEQISMDEMLERREKHG